MNFWGQHIVNLKRKFLSSSNNNIAKFLKLIVLGALIFLLGLYMSKIYQVPVHYNKVTIKGPNLKHSDMVRGQSVKMSFFKDYTGYNGYKMWFPDSCLSLSIVYILRDSLEGDYFSDVLEFAPGPSDSDIQIERIKKWNEQNLYGIDRAYYNYTNFVEKDLSLDSLLYAFNIEYISTKRNAFVLNNYFFENRKNVDRCEYEIKIPKGKFNYLANSLFDSLGIVKKNLEINQKVYVVDTIQQETKNHYIHNSFVYVSKKDSILYIHKNYHSPDQISPNILYTAEDISQCIEVLDLSLEPLSETTPLTELKYIYGGTANFSGLQPIPDSIFVNGFMYFDETKLSLIAKHGLRFYVSLPDMQNKQDFRIYFVTTILALFIGIFCSVLHDLFRKRLMNILNKYKFSFLLCFVIFIVSFIIIALRLNKNSSISPYELDYNSIGNHVDLRKSEDGQYIIDIYPRDSLYRMQDDF